MGFAVRSDYRESVCTVTEPTRIASILAKCIVNFIGATQNR